MYYDYFTNYAYRGSTKGKEITVAAALDQIPLFLRGGSVLATRERPRRSSPLMKHDPFTLRVALSKSGSARGELYLDDGESYGHEAGELLWREFTATKAGKATHIKSTDLAALKPAEAVDNAALAVYDSDNAFTSAVRAVRVEKLVVLGLPKKPASVTLGGTELDWEFVPGVASGASKEGEASQLIVKNPVASIAGDWEIVIS